MIKKILIVLLSLFVLAFVAIVTHLPTRHLAYRYYNGFQIYLQLEASYQTQPNCKEETKMYLCITTITKNIGGFRFGTDIGFALAVLINKNLSYDAYLQANTAFVRAIDPEKFWIRGIKGKSAKRVFAKEKKDLVKTLNETKKTIHKTIEEGRFPSSLEDHNSLLTALDAKIAELSE